MFYSFSMNKGISGEIKDDVKGAKKILRMDEYPYGFKKHCSCFLYTTENQSGINDIIGYKDKKMLVTAASGDQYLGAVYYGAREVDLFDIYRLTYPIIFLKIAANAVLDYHEYVDFLIPLDDFDEVKQSFWSLKTLKRLLNVLPKDIAYYWDKVMFEARKRGYYYLISFEHDSSKTENIEKGMPFYIDEAEYYKLQAMLRTREYPNFIESDILALKEKLASKYDIIYLSNIIESIISDRVRRYMFVSENTVEREVVQDIMSQVMPSLKEDGTILVTYRPNRDLQISHDWLFNNEFFQVDLVDSKFPPDEEDYKKSKDTDMVLTYRPSKTGDILKELR